MRKSTLGACVVALLMLATMVGSSLAQSATPASTTSTTSSVTSCVSTTPDQNLHVVRSYITAVLQGDQKTAAALLAPNYQSDLSSSQVQVPNTAGSPNQLQNIKIAQQADVRVLNIIAQNDWVALEMQFDLSGANLQFKGVDVSKLAPVHVIAFIRVECGQIAEGHYASDVLRALAQQGFQIVPPGGQ